MIYKLGNENLNGLRRSVRSNIINKFNIVISSNNDKYGTYNTIGAKDSNNKTILVINC